MISDIKNRLARRRAKISFVAAAGLFVAIVAADGSLVLGQQTREAAVEDTQFACGSEGPSVERCTAALAALEAIVQDPATPADTFVDLAMGYLGLAFLADGSVVDSARDKAKMHFTAAITKDAQQADAWLHLADLVDTISEQLEMLRRVTELQPLHPSAHARIAGILVRQADLDQAASEYILHLNIVPFDHASGDEAVTFFNDVRRRGGIESAVSVLTALLNRSTDSSADVQCDVFREVDLADVVGFDDVKFRLSERTSECR